VDDKKVVREYFNTKGFERWNRIYSEDGEVNKVQLDIRTGHAQTVAKILAWLDADGPLDGQTFCDAGCGVGSLALPLIARGARVHASDISAAMVAEAARRAGESLGDRAAMLTTETADLESLGGRYGTVCCVDVLIHYPDGKIGEMIGHLAGIAEKRMIISFAPKTWYYSALKRFGELFPGPSKATRAYLHSEEDVMKVLDAAGWKVNRREFTGTKFYFSTLLEVVKKD